MEKQGKVTVIISDDVPEYAGVYEMSAGRVSVVPSPFEEGKTILQLQGLVDKVDPNVVLGEGEILL